PEAASPREERPVCMSTRPRCPPPRPAPSRLLTTFRPVQEDPQDEVPGEINEVVVLTGPDEEDIPRLATPALVAPHEGGTPPEDDVDLVLGMVVPEHRLLPQRLPHLHSQAAVLEGDHRAGVRGWELGLHLLESCPPGEVVCATLSVHQHALAGSPGCSVIA